MRRLRSVKSISVASILACALALVVASLAYWTAPGSGSATKGVSSMTAPLPTATSPIPGIAHVAWSAVGLVPPVPAVDAEVTFTVERTPSGGSSWVFVCGTGTTPLPYDTLSCDDSPASTDTYDYRVTAGLRTWTSSGVASVSVVVDTTPPTSAITFPGAVVYSAASWGSGCSSALCGTASDTGGSGLQKVDVSLRQGSGSYWDGGAFTSATETWHLASGTSTWSYGFPVESFPADGQYTVSSRASDSASNVESPVTTWIFTIDTTAPVVTASTIAATVGTSSAGFVKQGAGYHVYADASDANGVASATADVSNVTTGQTAVALSTCVSSCTVGGHTYLLKSALLAATNPLLQGSTSYTVAAADVVGNTSLPVSHGVVVDNTGPSVTTVIAATIGTSPAGHVKQGGTYRVYANIADLPVGIGAASGVNTSSITANVSTVTTGQTAAVMTVCGVCGPGAVFAYQSAELTANNPLSEGVKAYTVSASDNLATIGASSGATVRADNTAPSVSTVIAATTGTSPQGFVKQAGGYRVYANVTDLPVGGASGVDPAGISANVANVTSGLTAVPLGACGACGPGSAYAYSTAELTASSALSEGSKSFSVSARDNLASSSSVAANVVVDNTAPGVSAVLANTATNEPGWLAQGGGYRVYATANDLPAGPGGASGLVASSLTTDVSSITPGQTAVALTTAGCPCVIGGTSYAYRSAPLTASSPLAAGTRVFTATASDNLGSTSVQGGSVTIDNTAPALSALEMFDTDANGRVDRVTATFDETLVAYSAGNTPWTLANAPGGTMNALASVGIASAIATLTLSEGTVNTASGAFTVALTASANGIRDRAGNQASFAATAVADRARPVPTNTVLANSGVLGQANNGDTITITYSETLDATSLCSTWTNSGTQTLSGAGANAVQFTITDAGTNDTFSVTDTGNGTPCGGVTNFRLGPLSLGGNYVSTTRTFAGNNQSVITWTPTARTLTFRLGNPSGATLTGVLPGTPVYTPSTLIDDLATPGNTMTATAFSAPATSRF